MEKKYVVRLQFLNATTSRFVRKPCGLTTTLELADQMFSSSNWPQFRGIGSRGLSDGLQVPQKWSVEAGEHVLWKTPIPGLGHSCPVVWDDLIFVTTAVSNDSDMSMKIGNYGDYKSIPEHADHEFLLIAVDKLTGEIRWQKTAHTALPQVKRHLKSTHANPTYATNGTNRVRGYDAVNGEQL